MRDSSEVERLTQKQERLARVSRFDESKVVALLVNSRALLACLQCDQTEGLHIETIGINQNRSVRLICQRCFLVGGWYHSIKRAVQEWNRNKKLFHLRGKIGETVNITMTEIANFQTREKKRSKREEADERRKTSSGRNDLG